MKLVLADKHGSHLWKLTLYLSFVYIVAVDFLPQEYLTQVLVHILAAMYYFV